MIYDDLLMEWYPITNLAKNKCSGKGLGIKNKIKKIDDGDGDFTLPDIRLRDIIPLRNWIHIHLHITCHHSSKKKCS